MKEYVLAAGAALLVLASGCAAASSPTPEEESVRRPIPAGPAVQPPSASTKSEPGQALDGQDPQIRAARFARAALPLDVTPDLSTDKAQYDTQSSVSVSFSGMDGAPNDYIAIAPAGSDPDTFVQYSMTDGASDGSFVFGPLPAGVYVVRAFFDQDSVIQAESAPFVVAQQ